MERLGKLDDFISDRVVRLDTAIDSMNEAFEEKMNYLEARIEKLLQSQNSCAAAAKLAGEGLCMLPGLTQPMVTVDSDFSPATATESDDNRVRQPQVPRASSSGMLGQGLSRALQETSPGKSPVPSKPVAEDLSGLTSPATPTRTARSTLSPQDALWPASAPGQVDFTQSPRGSPRSSLSSIAPRSPQPLEVPRSRNNPRRRQYAHASESKTREAMPAPSASNSPPVSADEESVDGISAARTTALNLRERGKVDALREVFEKQNKQTSWW